MGTQSPSPKRGRGPQFSAHVYCGQTAAWIKMPLATEVDIVLDGTQLPLLNKGEEPSPHFAAHVYCGQTAGWIKMALGMVVGLGPGHIVLDGDPAPFSQKGGSAPPPNFRPMFIVAKRLDASRWHLVWK